MKVCKKCKVKKETNFFSVKNTTKDGFRPICKKCASEFTINWKNNKKTDKKWNKKVANQKILKQYGITEDIWNEMFSNQEGRCMLCKKHQSDLKRKLHVDHCHETGKVRGLLCSSCNMGLGLFKDNIEVFRNVVKYLELHIK